MKLNDMTRWRMMINKDALGGTLTAEMYSDGDWVKYSDAKQAVQQAQIDTARMSREGDDAFIRTKNEEIDKLKCQIEELKKAKR